MDVRHSPEALPPVNSARVKAPLVAASPAASTRICMTPRLTVRPSPGATVCACPDSSIVLTCSVASGSVPVWTTPYDTVSGIWRSGIIERERLPTRRGWSYRLTEQGHDLKAVCEAMGQWGARWLEVEPPLPGDGPGQAAG